MTATLADTQIRDLEARLCAYLVGNDVIDPRISGLRRLTGGSTHDTWAFDLDHGTPADRGVMPLVLRRNLVDESLDMSPEAEFRLLQWLHDLGIPVARPWLCAANDGALSTPFVISERVNGSDLRKVMAKAGSTIDRRATGLGLVTLQAQLHALDLSQCPAGILAPPDIAHEVERWTRPLLEPAIGGASPLARAAIGWLRSNIPAVSAPCLVHGDFKANNILWSGDGRPTLLDWELAHIGDPMEDLAWTMLWMTKDDIVCGMLSPEDYIAAYEAVSGFAVDRERLFFWQLFGLVKLSGIMLTGNGTASDDGHLGPSHAMLSRGVACLDTAMADYLIATVERRAA